MKQVDASKKLIENNLLESLVDLYKINSVIKTTIIVNRLTNKPDIFFYLYSDDSFRTTDCSNINTARIDTNPP